MSMNDVTRILLAIEQAGTRRRAGVNVRFTCDGDEVQLAAQRWLAHESPGQTMPALALVHEAYMRLVDPCCTGQHWNSRGHFFAAAAEAMRRILVDQARRGRG